MKDLKFMGQDILGKYINGNYSVMVLSDGTKIRRTPGDEFIPEFAENCDVKITDKCDGGCKYCYEGCTVNGKHANLFYHDGPVAQPRQAWLKDLKPFTELALNGNDLSHPDLHPEHPVLLEYLREKKVIANITVNQKHFMEYYGTLRRWVEEDLIYGVGVSLVDSTGEEFIKRVSSFPNAVIHTIAGILTEEDLENLKGKNLKVLILGYKTLNRGLQYYMDCSVYINNRIEWLKSRLDWMTHNFKVVSFDNLAIEQLNVREVLFAGKEKDWDTFYGGDDGTMTFYIDAVNQTFSKNSCMPSHKRYPIRNMGIVEMFQQIREKHGKEKESKSN